MRFTVEPSPSGGYFVRLAGVDAPVSRHDTEEEAEAAAASYDRGVRENRVGDLQRLPDGREATWDSDGTASLEAQVMRNGVLVGFVPEIPGSDSFTEEQIIDTIRRTDYDKPIATQRSKAPTPAPALPRQGGLFRRFLGGFREH